MNIRIYEKLREANRGFSILSLAIQNRDRVYLLFENDHESRLDNPKVKIFSRLTFYYRNTERVWGYGEYSGIYRAKVCYIPPPEDAVLIVDFNGQTVRVDANRERPNFENGLDEAVLPALRQVTVQSLRTIAGQAYVAGGLRTVFRREGPNQWTCMTGNDLSVQALEIKRKQSLGFDDIGGFAADDLYACGDGGDLFHYDGARWRGLDPPTNADLRALCCAPNGQVYVGGRDGLLLEGRGTRWRQIGARAGFSVDARDPERRGMGAEIHDLTWFRDRLYLATDRGLYEYHDGQIQPASGLGRLITGRRAQDGDPALTPRVRTLLEAGGADPAALDLLDAPAQADGPADGVAGPFAIYGLAATEGLLLAHDYSQAIAFDGTRWWLFYDPRPGYGGGSL